MGAGNAGNSREYTLSRIDYQSSLSHSAVLSIFQDSSGMMWFGTYDGLNSYDGREMIVYRSDFSKATTLSNNVIHSVCQADNSCLWVNTYLSLNRFCGDLVEKIYDFGGNWSIHSNSRGNTYLIHQDSLLYYNTLHKEFLGLGVKLSGGDAEINKRVFVSEAGELWFFPDDSGKIKIYSASSFDADSSSVRLSVSSFDFHSKPVDELFYQDGTVCFVDRYKDLYMYDLERRSKIYIRNISDLKDRYGDINGIVPFYEDIFIGFRINGLVKLLASDKYSAEEMDKNMRIYGLYKDSEQGILWVATDGLGAVQYSHEGSVATSLMLNRISGSLSRQVRSILTDRNGDLWFGTKGDGLVHVPSYLTSMDDGGPVAAEVLSPEGRSPASGYIRSNHEFQVYSLQHSNCRDGFWVGTGDSGLMFYSFGKQQLLKLDNDSRDKIREIHSIVEDSDSVLYVGTADKGFYKVGIGEDGGRLKIKDTRRYIFYDKGREVDMFFQMIADGDSLLWLGSRGNGLVKFDRRTDEYRVISLKDLLDKSVDDILSLCKASDGKIYVGTTSGLVGMSYSDGHMDAVYIGREQGLANDMIHGILEDSYGFLWLSTNRGLIKYNTDTGTSHAYYYSAGVSIGEFSDDAYYGSPYTGDLFFGGVDGLLWLNKETDFIPVVDREVVLRRLTVDRKIVNITDYYDFRGGVKTIRLGGAAVSFSVLFGVPDFLTNRSIEYSYILDGYDKDWSVFSSLNEASFSFVPPGRYVFRIRYKKDVFDLDYKTFSIPVRIVPPWYRSPWTIFSCSLFLLAMLAGFCLFMSRRGFVSFRSGRPASGNSAGGQELVDRFAVIWHCCDRIRSGELSPGEMQETVDLIKDTMSGILGEDGCGNFIESVCPQEYVVRTDAGIGGIVREVMDVLEKESADVSAIRISVPENLVFPVYVNALRRVLYFGLRHFAGNAAGVEVDAGIESDGRLCLAFVCGEDAVRLHAEMISVLGGMLRHLDAETRDRDGRIEVVFRRAEDVRKEEDATNMIVLLGASADLVYLTEDVLASSYVVQSTDDADKAFRLLKHSSVSLFMVDMRMFEGREREFLDRLYRNKDAVSKVPFLPMFTKDNENSVCRELILVSDAYMMLPYDVLMLKNVVHKAIFGKSDIMHVQVEDISRLGGKLFCTNDEDAGFVRKVLGAIDENLDRDDLGTVLLADRVAMSPSRFYRKAKKIFGISPEVLIKNYRMEKASRLLMDDRLSIADVITDVGISSRSYFYKEFSSRFGMTPGEYRERFCSNRS